MAPARQRAGKGIPFCPVNHASITPVRVITRAGMASTVVQAFFMTVVRTIPVVGALCTLPA